MTPSERLLKSVHMAIERNRVLLDQVSETGTHHIRISVKPRRDGWRVAVGVESYEETV